MHNRENNEFDVIPTPEFVKLLNEKATEYNERGFINYLQNEFPSATSEVVEDGDLLIKTEEGAAIKIGGRYDGRICITVPGYETEYFTAISGTADYGEETEEPALSSALQRDIEYIQSIMAEVSDIDALLQEALKTAVHGLLHENLDIGDLTELEKAALFAEVGIGTKEERMEHTILPDAEDPERAVLIYGHSSGVMFAVVINDYDAEFDREYTSRSIALRDLAVERRAGYYVPEDVEIEEGVPEEEIWSQLDEFLYEQHEKDFQEEVEHQRELQQENESNPAPDQRDSYLDAGKSESKLALLFKSSTEGAERLEQEVALVSKKHTVTNGYEIG